MRSRLTTIEATSSIRLQARLETGQTGVFIVRVPSSFLLAMTAQEKLEAMSARESRISVDFASRVERNCDKKKAETVRRGGIARRGRRGSEADGSEMAKVIPPGGGKTLFAGGANS